MRIGILTAGGDCPGLNAAIRAVAKRLLFEHRAEVLGFEDGYLGLIERRARPIGPRDVSGILLQGGTMLGSDNRADPFRYFGAGGADVSDRVVSYCRDLELEGLVVIGGDGSMSVAHALHRRGVPVVGVPKTIDNDLVGTERTIGFDTAVGIAAEAVDRIHTTTQSHHRVFLVETMGRDTGWIALHAGLAAGADVILIPEIPYELEEIERVCRARQVGEQRFTIVVVAEGAIGPDGRPEVRQVVPGSPEPVRLGGVSHAIAERLDERLEAEVRATVLGHMQRGGSPTATDRVLATELGSHAARLVAEGRFGLMAAIRNGGLTEVPIEEVAGRTRRVPPDSPLIDAAIGVGVSMGQPAARLRARMAAAAAPA